MRKINYVEFLVFQVASKNYQFYNTYPEILSTNTFIGEQQKFHNALTFLSLIAV